MRFRLASALRGTAGRCGAALALVLALAAPLAYGETDKGDTPPTVASVDLGRYLGTWYEIARLPNRFQRKCASDVEAQYRAESGGIRVLNRCRTAEGRILQASGHARTVAGSGDARLRVSFFWPFYGDYWILALAPDYSDVLVGEPSRRMAWVLSRRRDLPQARLSELLELAQSLGFDSRAFQKTAQIEPLDAAAP